MADFITGHDMEFYEQLQKLIKIPPHCRRITLDVAYDEVATVTFEVVAEKGTGEPITKKYNLVEVK